MANYLFGRPHDQFKYSPGMAEEKERARTKKGDFHIILDLRGGKLAVSNENNYLCSADLLPFCVQRAIGWHRIPGA